MFSEGFAKVAALGSKNTGTPTHAVRGLKSLTGAPEMAPFGRPWRRFAGRGRSALIPLSRIRDGLR